MSISNRTLREIGKAAALSSGAVCLDSIYVVHSKFYWRMKALSENLRVALDRWAENMKQLKKRNPMMFSDHNPPFQMSDLDTRVHVSQPRRVRKQEM